ncbi:DNA-binding protein [Streptomyces tsukubensis]|nr:DNA-binding protein [Streptomyces tsukubensis]
MASAPGTGATTLGRDSGAGVPGEGVGALGKGIPGTGARRKGNPGAGVRRVSEENVTCLLGGDSDPFAGAPVKADASVKSGVSGKSVPSVGSGASVDSVASVGSGASVDSVALSWRGRWGSAVKERLPLWLQVRCGLERRSVVALAVVLVVATGFAVQHFWAARPQPVAAPPAVREPAGARSTGGVGQEASAGSSGASDAARASGASGASPALAAVPGASGGGQAVIVDVGGKVRRPGVRRLPPGSRVADALRAAGGVRPGADTAGLNRARLLVDGEQVLVGVEAPTSGGASPVAGASGGVAPSGGGALSGGGAAVPAGRVALSTATVEQLDTLPGVGPVLAQRIIDYRDQHGGFRSVDELQEVNGIGDRRFTDLQNVVRP